MNKINFLFLSSILFTYNFCYSFNLFPKTTSEQWEHIVTSGEQANEFLKEIPAQSSLQNCQTSQDLQEQMNITFPIIAHNLFQNRKPQTIYKTWVFETNSKPYLTAISHGYTLDGLIIHEPNNTLTVVTKENLDTPVIIPDTNKVGGKGASFLSLSSSKQLDFINSSIRLAQYTQARKKHDSIIADVSVFPVHTAIGGAGATVLSGVTLKCIQACSQTYAIAPKSFKLLFSGSVLLLSAIAGIHKGAHSALKKLKTKTDI